MSFFKLTANIIFEAESNEEAWKKLGELFNDLSSPGDVDNKLRKVNVVDASIDLIKEKENAT